MENSGKEKKGKKSLCSLVGIGKEKCRYVHMCMCVVCVRPCVCVYVNKCFDCGSQPGICIDFFMQC